MNKHYDSTCPVLLVSGFLGAGKTSLISRLIPLLQSGGIPTYTISEERPLVILENDFGDVSFDASLLRRESVTVRELASGCICCSLALDFRSALREIRKEYNPGLLIIEPSGIGILSELLGHLKEAEMQQLYGPCAALTLVDYRFFDKYLNNFGEFFEDQLRFADRILLNRAGEMNSQQFAELSEKVREVAPRPDLIVIDIEQAGEEELAEVVTRIEGDAQEYEARFTEKNEVRGAMKTKWVSVSLALQGLTTAEELKQFFDLLEGKCRGRLLRAKGTVCLSSGLCLQLQWIPGEISIHERKGEGHLSFIFSALSPAHFRFLVQQCLRKVKEAGS